MLNPNKVYKYDVQVLQRVPRSYVVKITLRRGKGCRPLLCRCPSMWSKRNEVRPLLNTRKMGEISIERGTGVGRHSRSATCPCLL